MNYAEKLKDPRWQKKRLEIMQRDNFTCQWCLDKKSTLNIHHFYYTKNGNPWETEDHGLVTLCENCHTFMHLNIPEPVLNDLFCMLIIDPRIHSKAIRILVESAINNYK